MRSLWAAALLLRRLRTERGIILLIFGLITVTSFVFAAAPRLFNRVSDDALAYAVRLAPASERNLTLRLDTSLAPGAEGGVAEVRAHGDKLAEQIPNSVAALISDRSLRITSVSFFVSDPLIYETHISLRYKDGLPDATRLVSGRWPVDRGVPLPLVSVRTGSDVPGDGPKVEPVILETALSTAEATELGVRVGDRLAVTLDPGDSLVRNIPYQIASTELQVVGLYEPLDPNAEYWDGDANLLQVSLAGTDDHPIAYATAYIPAEMYPSLYSSGLPFHYEWGFRIDPQRLDAGRVAVLQVDLRRLGLITDPIIDPSSGTIVVLTGLPGILDRYASERALSESVLSIAAIGPFGLAGGAIAMVAILLVRQRRTTLVLARGRGASGALVLGTQLWEAMLLAGSASLAGLLMAVIAIPARASSLSPALAFAVAGAAVVLMVGANWPTARRPLGQLERDDTPLLRVAPRRLVVEMTIVFIAVAAVLLLRQRGLTVGAPDSAARFDPLLASVPVLSGLAAGIVALRLYPLPIRALAWLAAQRRDVVPVLGLRTIGRHPAAANLPLLVLLLTAAFASFSSVIASSVNQGQVVASYQEVGADYRVERIGMSVLPPSLNPAAIAGVEAVAPGVFDVSAAFASTRYQRATIYLEAVDPETYAEVVAGTAADPRWPAAFLGEPAGTSLGTEENPIPAILSLGLPAGSADLGPGDTFRITVSGQSLVFRLVQQRASFPGIGERPSFAVVPFNWVQAAFGNRLLPPSILWLRAPGDVAKRLAATVAELTDSARIVSRYDAYATLHDRPLGAVVATGYELALVIAAIYMGLTILGAVVLSGTRQTRDLAYLRTLGLSAPQGLALTIMEHAPPVLLALVPGVALGIGVAILCEPGLGLATFVGDQGVPLFVDWPALLLMVAALIAVAAAAVSIGTWLSRRARLVDALRIGDD